MIHPTEKDVGRQVIYIGNRVWGGADEEGVITSFNEHTIFVRYTGDTGSKGTKREDLEWSHPQTLSPLPATEYNWDL